MTSIGPLTFGPDGVLFAADTQAATIYALELGDKANGGAPGTQAVDAIDQKIAGLLGTDAKEIAITDMVGASAHAERLHRREARPGEGRPTASRRCSGSTAQARSRSSRSRT